MQTQASSKADILAAATHAGQNLKLPDRQTLKDLQMQVLPSLMEFVVFPTG